MGESVRKQALVLSGGSIKGAFQAGAIAEILKPQYKFRPTGVFGISVGSINGGMLASYLGQEVRKQKAGTGASAVRERKLPILLAGERLENYWRNDITDFKKLGHKRWKLVILWEVIFGTFGGMVNVDEAIGIIRREIKSDDLKLAADSGNLEFYAGTLDLTSGGYFDKKWDDADIIEYVIASSMMPIVMPMRDIKPTPPKPSKPVAPKTESVTERMKKNAAQEFADLKEWYQSKRVEGHKDRDDSWLDGGVHNVAPLEKAIALGYDDIVCIACRPAKIGRGAFRGNLGSLGERISDVIAQTLLDADISQALKINDWVEIIQKVANLQSASLTNEEATALTTLRGKYKNVDVRLIRPKDELPFDMKTFTGGDIGTMIRLGRERAIPAMAKPLTSEEFKRLQALEGETAASA